MRHLLLLCCTLALSAADHPSPWLDLVHEIIPLQGEVRPPCIPAAYDPNADGLTNLQASLAARVLPHQNHLLTRWFELRDRQPIEPRNQRALTLLAYAFGETTREITMQAATGWPANERLQFARLLLAECRSEAAVSILTELAEAGPRDPIGAAAGGEIIQLLRRRSIAASQVACIPLQPDPADWYHERLGDADWLAVFSALPNLENVSNRVEAHTNITSTTYREWEHGRSMRVVEWKIATATPLDLEVGLFAERRLDLAVDGFHLNRRARHWPRDGRIVIDLHTRFHGEIELTLYRIADHAAWLDPHPEILTTSPVYRWSERWLSLTCNNRFEVIEVPIELTDLSVGRYLLCARARYCPVIATARFAVSASSSFMLSDGHELITVTSHRETGEILHVPRTLGMSSGVTITPDSTGLIRTPAEPGTWTVTDPSATDPHQTRLTITAAVEPFTRPVRYIGWAAEPAVRTGMRMQLAAARFPPWLPGVHKISLRGPDDRIVISRQLPLRTGDHLISFDWVAPHHLAEGTYTLLVNNEPIDGAIVEVSDYTLPNYRFLPSLDHSWVGQAAHITFKLEHHDCSAAAGVAYTMHCEGQRHRGQTDTAGRALWVHDFGGAPRTLEVSIDIPGNGTNHRRQAVRHRLIEQPFSVSVVESRSPGDECRSHRNPTCNDAFQAQLVIGSHLHERVDSVRMRGSNHTFDRMVTVGECFEMDLPTHEVGHHEYHFILSHAGIEQEWNFAYTVHVPRPQQLTPVMLSQQKTAAHRLHDEGLIKDANAALAHEHLAIESITLPSRLDERRPFERTIKLGRPDAVPYFTARYTPYVAVVGKPFDMGLTLGEREDRPHKAQVLVTIANDRIRECSIREIGFNDHKLQLTPQPDWYPGVTIRVDCLDGDHHSSDSQRIYVVPPENILQLAVRTGQKTVTAGELVNTSVQVSDALGRWVEHAQCTLAVVDAALLKQCRYTPPDLVKHCQLFDHREQLTGAFDAAPPALAGIGWWLDPRPCWQRALSCTAAENACMGRSHACSGRLAGERQAIPSNALAAWHADLITDANGMVDVAVTLPRTGTWVFIARAITAEGCGEGRGRVIARP